MDPRPKPLKQHGFNLLEVVIGLAMFAIGLLAIASLQGNLTRSHADASVRTVATHIAEELIEDYRGFGLVETDPAGVIPAYQDIVNETRTISRGGVDYVAITQVTDYYYDLATDSFATANPEGLLVSDFKEVRVTVSWGAAPGFRVTEGVEVSANDIGTGRTALATVISSVSTQGSGRAQTQRQAGLFNPDVEYTPGQNPDVVSLQLGDNRFKESTLPEPRVYRQDEKVETRLDVVTYSQTQAGSQFLRREEFIAVSCECTLRAPPSVAEDGGRWPTVWVGDEYELGELAIKPYGESASNQQSVFCDVCCRDHHDGLSAAADPAAAKFNPFRPAADYWSSGTFNGDHKHYGRNSAGQLVLADDPGDRYVEACRMVRVDGFMRVAQDARQEGRNLFPENYLDEDAEIDDYSSWVTTATNSFENALAGDYETMPPSLAPPPLAPADGGFPTSTTLPTATGATTQQLRSRGVYIDYMRDDLRVAIDCLRALPESGEASDCDSDTIQFDRTGSKNVLEVIPFFDVQLTWLNRWTESPANVPVDTTNEPVLTDNAHSRGVASKNAVGNSQVYATGHRGNIGWTDTDPIDPNFSAQLSSAQLQVESVSGTPPPPPGTLVINGLISSGVNGLKATDVQVVGVNANCNRSPNGYSCQFSSSATGVELKVFGYKKAGFTLAACSATLSQTSSGTDANGRGFAYFLLSPSPALDPAVSHDITIQQGGCSL